MSGRPSFEIARAEYPGFPAEQTRSRMRVGGTLCLPLPLI